jgi:hypothetical protein
LHVRLLLCLPLLACATVEPSKPIVEFPSVASIAALERKPIPAARVEAAEIPASSWTVEAGGTATALFETWSPATPAENILARAYLRGGKPPRFSKALHCVARELGRFLLETGATPPDGLRTFILGACGAVARDVGMARYGGEVPARASDVQVASAWSDGFGDLLAKHVPADASEVGVWFGRARGRGYAVAAYDKLNARYRAFSLVPEASSEVVVEGAVEGGVEFIAAYINKGRFAAESCFVDPSVARPQFRVICHMAEEDQTAWVQILRAEPRRVLAFPFAQFLLRRDPAQSFTYRSEPYADPRPVATAAQLSPVVLEQLNRVRQSGGLPPVKLAAAQSATAGNLAGHYFSAALGAQGAQVMDDVALGMLAGWQVSDGMIRDASFVSTLVPHTLDAGRWLSEALSMPVGRNTLLDPEIASLAIGPALMKDPDTLGAVVVGYRFHQSADHASDVRRLFMRVAAARRKMKLPMPGRLGQLKDTMLEELGRVHAGKSQPMEALQSVLESGVGRFGTAMRGYVVEATSLNALQIPEEILKQPTLHLEIGVTHHRPPGAAWGQLVILVAYVDYAETGT